ncbi:MAG: hypothetical protein WC592_01755 [Candidatus Omnitrophota bacterium]|nr:hypothetical protein [Candidatus Omnitrophota bacterium]
MKRLIILFFVIGFIAAAVDGYRHFRSELRTNLALNTRVARVVDFVKGVGDRAGGLITGMNREQEKFIRKVTKSVKLPDVLKKDDEDDGITLYLKHGGVINGRLLEKKADEYIVEWDNEKFAVSAKQVVREERKSRKEAQWPYKNDIVAKRTNGVVLDGKITDITGDEMTMSFDEGGGGLEMTVKRADIDYLIFAPALNKESDDIERRLKEQFPKMKMYKEGDIVLFSDSYAKSIDLYVKTVRQAHTDIYFKFFKIFKGRTAGCQNFLVMFDDIEDYWTYAITDGVPGWLVVGYFSPLNKVLYTYNGFGNRMEKWVLEIVEGQTGAFNKEVIDKVKDNVVKSYHIFLEGQAKEFTDIFWEMHSIYKSELLYGSLDVLRHEFTHEVFHNYGLQSIVIMKPDMDDKKLAEKKKELMAEKDWKKKKEILEEIMKIRRETSKDLEKIKREDIINESSAQSWLNEGIATYCGTDPIGSVDEEWLFSYQEAVRKNELNPIEFLTNFKIGSFVGLVNKAAFASYGESWAFTSFLMNRYHEQFMDYQVKMSERMDAKKKGRDSGADDLNILLGCLGKDLPALEEEFREYMGSYARVEDPDVKRYMRYHDVWEKLMQFTTIGRHISTRHAEEP